MECSGIYRMELNRKETALALNIDCTTLDSWADKGCPSRRNGKGTPARYVLADVVRWRVEHEVSRALEAVSRSTDAGDLDALRARKMVAEACIREIQLARARADLIPAEEFELALSSMLVAARVQVCEVLPVRAARRVLGETDETRLREALRDEARTACADLADADADDIFRGIVADLQAQEIGALR